jgi:hypothetical protein
MLLNMLGNFHCLVLVIETHYFTSWFCFHYQAYVGMLLSLLGPSDADNFHIHTTTIVLVRVHPQLLISRTNNLYLHLLLIFDIYSSYILVRTSADVLGLRLALSYWPKWAGFILLLNNGNRASFQNIMFL